MSGMDVDSLAASSGIALALSVGACISLWRFAMKQVDRNYEKDKTVAELAAALKESNGLTERLLRDREG